MDQNFQAPDRCFSCGSLMPVVNCLGIRQCPNGCAGAVWDPVDGWDPAARQPKVEAIIERERSHEPHIPKPHPLQPVADYLDYSLRQAVTIVKTGEALGIKYADGVAHVSSHGHACVGPIGDDRFYRFTLPRGTESVATAVCSGVISSGFVACRTEIAGGKIGRHIEARAEVGYSGLMLGVVCFNASGEVIAPPILDL